MTTKNDELIKNVGPIIEKLESIRTQEEYDQWVKDNPEKLELVAEAIYVWMTKCIRLMVSQ